MVQNPFNNYAHSSILSLSLQADLAQLYIKAGLKNMGTVFLLTDAQVPDEKFLVLINDLLASGEIPDLFAGKPSVLVCTNYSPMYNINHRAIVVNCDAPLYVRT